MIVPTDRPDTNPDEPAERGEVADYLPWMVAHGIDWVDVTFEASVATGSHAPDAVWRTGDLEVLIPPARRLAEAGCDALAWPCTCASFIGGLEWSRAQAAALKRASGLPTTTTSLALLAAIETLGADRVDVLSPYPAPVTAAFGRFLHDAGIEVGAIEALDCADDSISVKLDLLAEAKRFGGGLRGPAPVLVVPDTAVYSLGAAAKVEAEIGRPVVAANQATLWHCLGTLGIACDAADGGVLFGHGREPARRGGDRVVHAP